MSANGLHHSHVFNFVWKKDNKYLIYAVFNGLSDWLQKLFEINQLMKAMQLEVITLSPEMCQSPKKL